MHRRKLALIAVMAVTALPAVSRTQSLDEQRATAFTTSSSRQLVDRYCVSCHNERTKAGGLALSAVDLGDAAANAQILERVVRKLRGGLMPPAGRPRPDGHTLREFRTQLETELDAAARAHPNPGRTDTLHRLNRAEFRNAVRDVLGVDIDVSSLLPADDASYGFDNIAGVLRMSPTLLDRYLAAAQKVSRAAVGLSPATPVAETFRVPADLPQNDHIEGLPFGTRGGTLIRYSFPSSGEYTISAKLARDIEDNIPRFDEPDDLEVTIDGRRVVVFPIPADPDRGASSRDATMLKVRQSLDAMLDVRVPIQAGAHQVGVAFLKKPAAQVDTVYGGAFSARFLELKQPFQRPYAGGFGNDDMRFQPYLASVTITGPFNAVSSGKPGDGHASFGCRPLRATEERACAKTIFAKLARRAYRRRIGDADLEPLLHFFEQGRSDGFDAGIELALQRLLVSPDFLFRIERDPATVARGAAYRISDLELASRLSFFLWSSVPDDELLDAAARGQLHDAGVLEREVRRMLADRRSAAFAANFTGQWLYLRNLPAIVPDPHLFPDFDESLRQAFRREIELFFDTMLREDRSALDLLTAKDTFLNERLATHYGVPNVKGDHFRRVVLEDENRWGLLGKGAILVTTAYPNRTSPVLRGKWILENLLGTPPPAPPPNVPSLKDTNAAGQVLSMRDRMAQHRANPVCASCHATMDPVGFSLENFDAAGQWRVRGESFAPIDASGTLPDGESFDGVVGLRAALVRRSDVFATTLTEKLLVYALGRGLEYYDAPAVRAIVREAAGRDYRFSSIVLAIARSTPFQMRRPAGGNPPATLASR
jgi:mono/diheme cytochrome c family protein